MFLLNNTDNETLNMKKPKQKIKPCTAWALVDPETWELEPHRIYDERVRNAGRGSVTEGWKCVRVEIRAIGKPRL